MQQGSVRVLVIDDDWEMLLMVRSALESEGYEVQPALNGLDALVQVERCRTARPSLVLTDLRMPMLHGWEFVQAFREQWGDGVPIIIMTGAGDGVPDELQRDISAVLRKPFDLDELLETVAFHLPATKTA